MRRGVSILPLLAAGGMNGERLLTEVRLTADSAVQITTHGRVVQDGVCELPVVPAQQPTQLGEETLHFFSVGRGHGRQSIQHIRRLHRLASERREYGEEKIRSRTSQRTRWGELLPVLQDDVVKERCRSWK